MADIGHVKTDEILFDLEKKIHKAYEQTYKEMSEKVTNRLESYENKLAKKQADLSAGKITKADFDIWKKNQIHMVINQQGLVDTLAKDLTNTDEIAAAMINGHTPSVYALNYNFGTYQVEDNIKTSTSFALYNHNTVEILLRDNPKLLPKAKINIPKDLAWNKKHISAAITQGILQGESIPKMAKRLQNAVGMSDRAAVRNARTATTGAQNMGRVSAYQRAKDMGIDLKQQWLAAMDNRTRHSHRQMDGQIINMGEKFDNGCRYPGDPEGPGHEIYNCRCTLVPVIKGFERPDDWRQTEGYKSWKNMGFDDWLGEQAAPDVTIQNTWGDKKYGYVYNLIKNSTEPGHGADANNFYYALKDLGEKSGIGKPPQVWNAYMTGQLDAEDLKAFEDIIKKYVPKDVSPVVKTADDLDDYAKFMTKWVGKDIYNPEISKSQFSSIYDHIVKKGAYSEEDIEEYFNNWISGKIKDEDLAEILGYKKAVAHTSTASMTNKILSQAEFEKKVDLLKDPTEPAIFHDSKISPLTYDGDKLMDVMFGGWKNEKHFLGYMDVNIEDIITVQPYVQGDKLKKFIGEVNTSEIQLLKIGNKYYLGDGNHRISAAYLKGNKTVKVKVYTEDENLLKNTKVVDKFDNAADTTKAVSKISKEAQDQIDKFKFKAGEAMTKDEADTYKVNPFYDKDFKDAKINCQTCSFAYELRRQGYDVVALPKYEMKADDAEFKKILSLQNKLGQDQKNGWINKITGQPPKALIHQDNMNYTTKGAFLADLEKNVGTNGERYIMGVNWKSGGAHSICVDRDEKGVIRIIDNQRGPGEKNTWTAEEYFNEKNIANIRRLYRVDDCAPNAEYLNAIVVDAKKIKLGLTDKVSDLPQYTKIAKYAKTDNMKTSVYYTKWKAGMIDNPDLDKLMGFTDDFDKAILPQYNNISDVMVKLGFSDYDEVFNELEKLYDANHITKSSVFNAYKKGEIQSDKLDEIFAKVYSKNLPKKIDLPDFVKTFDFVDPQTGELLDKVKEFEKIKKMTVTNLDDMAVKLTKDYYDLSLDDAKKLLKESGLNIPEKKTVSTVFDFAKKDLDGKSWGEVQDILFDKLDAIDPDNADDIVNQLSHKLYELKHDLQFPTKNTVLQQYINGNLQDKDLDDIFAKIYGKPAEPSVPVSATEVIDFDAIKNKTASAIWKELNNAKAGGGKFWKDITDIGKAKGMKPAEAWKKYLAGELDADDVKKIETHLIKLYKAKDKADNIPDFKKALPDTLLDAVNKFDDDIAEKIWNKVDNELTIKYGLTSDGAWKKYLAGEIKDPDLDEIFAKIYAKPAKAADVKDITKTVAKADNIIDYSKYGGKDVYEILSKYDDFDDFVTAPANEFDKVTKVLGTDSDNIKKVIKEIKSDKAVPSITPNTPDVSKPTTANAVDMDLLKTKKVSKVWNELKDQGGTAYSQFWKTVGEVGKDYGLEKKQSKVWDLYINGKLKPEESKKIDDFLLKHYFKKADDVIDYSKYGGKELYNILSGYKDYDDLFISGSLSDNNAVMNFFGNFSNYQDEINKAINEIKDLEDKIAKTTTTKAAATKADDVIKAEAKLKKAEDELKKIPNPTYKGIWKDDVTLADYETKKGTIAAKKIYYDEELDKLKNDPSYKSWLSDADKQQKIQDLQKMKNDLDDFEVAGKEYAKLQKAVADAQKEVNDLTPKITGGKFDPDDYTDAAKKAARSFSNRTSADKYHRAYLDSIWNDLKDEEKYSVWEYTRNSNPMNKSLSGYHDDWSRSCFIGFDKTDWGHEDNWRSLSGTWKKFGKNGHATYHKAITDLTNAIEKSSLPENTYLVRGSDINGLAGMIEGKGFMSFADAKKLLSGNINDIKAALEGQTVKNHAFTSTGIAKGTGFGGSVKFEIYAPKGTHAIYAEPQSYYGNTSASSLYHAGKSYSSVGGEAEVTIQRGTEYRITEITGSPGNLTIKMEVVDQPDYFKYGDEDTFNNGATRHKK